MNINKSYACGVNTTLVWPKLKFLIVDDHKHNNSMDATVIIIARQRSLKCNISLNSLIKSHNPGKLIREKNLHNELHPIFQLYTYGKFEHN